MSTSSPTRSPDRRAVAVAVAVIVVLLAVYGAALVRGREAPNVAASVADIQADADDVMGERWVVAGEVTAILGNEVLLVAGPGFGTDPLAVLLTSRAREAVDDGISTGDVGQFVGQFRELDVDELERQTRGDLPEERLESLEGAPLLVADRAAVDQRVR